MGKLEVWDRKQVLLGSRKRKKTLIMSVTLTKDAKEMIDEIASENGLSRSAAVEMAIRRLHRALDLAARSIK